MKFLLAALVALPGVAMAGGLAQSKGALILNFDGSNCSADRTKSVVFGVGPFPFTALLSRVESATDTSHSEREIRLQLTGWVSEMTDFRKAELVIQGSAEALEKLRFSPNPSERFIRVTTDPRCQRVAALVESVNYVYNWD